MKNKCLILFAAAALFSMNAYALLLKSIVISDAWVQAMPAAQKTTAAYMTITNNSSKAVTLLSASSDIAAATEIHQMSEMNGMMKMAMAPDLSIPAQGKTALAPGGYHLMLIDLKKPVKAGDTVPITLHFSDGTTETIHAQVKS